MGNDADFLAPSNQVQSTGAATLQTGADSDLNRLRAVTGSSQNLNDALQLEQFRAQGLQPQFTPFDAGPVSAQMAALQSKQQNIRQRLEQIKSNVGALSLGESISPEAASDRDRLQRSLVSNEESIGGLQRQLDTGRGELTGFEQLQDDELSEEAGSERDIIRGFFDQSLANQRGETPDSLLAVQDLEDEQLQLEEQLRRAGLQPGDAPYDRALRDFNDRKEARLQELRRTERGDINTLLQGTLTGQGNRTSQTLAQLAGTGQFSQSTLGDIANLINFAQLGIGNDLQERQFQNTVEGQQIDIENERRAQRTSTSNQKKAIPLRIAGAVIGGAANFISGKDAASGAQQGANTLGGFVGGQNISAPGSVNRGGQVQQNPFAGGFANQQNPFAFGGNQQSGTPQADFFAGNFLDGNTFT